MKILNSKIDLKNKSGTLDVIPENTDDIYTLYNFVDRGDHIKSKTTRKINIGDSNDSKGKSSKTTVKVTINLEIKVESISVDLEASTLFIKGIILSNNIEHVKCGSNHTIDIFPGHRFKIYKNQWTQLALNSFKQVQKNNSSEMLFIIIQQNKFIFCDVTQNFTNIKKKLEFKGKNYKQILSYINQANLMKYNIIVVASNTDVRFDFQKAVHSDKNLKQTLEKKLVIIKTEKESNDTMKTINDLLMDPCSSKTFMNIQFVEELKEMSFFLKNIEAAHLVSVGFKELSEALDFGAVKTVLVTNEMFKSYDVDLRKKVEEICNGAKGIRAKICIIPVKHWLGEKLQEMGGIAGNLKYEYK